MNVVSAE